MLQLALKSGHDISRTLMFMFRGGRGGVEAHTHLACLECLPAPDNRFTRMLSDFTYMPLKQHGHGSKSKSYPQ